MTARRLTGWLLLACAGLLLVGGLVFAVLLRMADRGAFDDRIAGWASKQLNRPVRMAKVELHLFSHDPTIAIQGLVVANPTWIGKGNLAEVDSIVAHIELAPLLHGKLRATAIAISGARLHLIRYGPGRNNWTFTDHPRSGPALAPLADVASFAITDSRIDVHDFGRDLFLDGPFRHDTGGAKPFRFQSTGTLKGFPVSLAAAGGQLNGPGVGPAWPFRAQLVDAATQVAAQGVAAQPFDLSRYDLGMTAKGPNMADIGYLFNFNMPNSGPYRLAARARSDGAHYGFSNIRGQVGASDVTGWLKSDHSGMRRRMVASFHAGTLARADVDALLAPIPPRAQARAASGIVKAVATGKWILPDATFGLARLRATDFTLSVAADRTAGYALPLEKVSTRILSDDGLLRFTDFHSALYGGTLDGSALLDARPDVPRIVAKGRLRGARLARIGPEYGQPPAAALDLDVDLSGTGPSVHAAAAKARGTVSGRLTDAVMPRRAGWILGGDMLRALSDAKGKDLPATLPIACAAGSVRGGGDGILNITSLGVRTAIGTARGSGYVDLGQERMRVFLMGQPDKRRLFQVAAPIRVEGPLLAPKLVVLPGRKARALGLKGKLGLALTPVTGLLPIKGKPLNIPLAPDAGC